MHSIINCTVKSVIFTDVIKHFMFKGADYLLHDITDLMGLVCSESVLGCNILVTNKGWHIILDLTWYVNKDKHFIKMM